MKTVIIEDELPQADQLRAMLGETSHDVEIIAVLQSVKEAVAFLPSHPVDLIFLDIHLADGLCFSIFEQISVSVPVIFTTAFDQYAIDAFRHNGIDYLLKPISRIDLERSLDKFAAFTLQSPDMGKIMDSIRQALAEGRSFRKRFIVRLGKKLKIICAEDAAYFYALGGGVFIRTFNNENLLTDHTLEDLEKELDPSVFFRLNRKVIAQVAAIRELLPYSKSRIKAILTPPFEEETIISYNQVKAFMQWIRK